MIVEISVQTNLHTFYFEVFFLYLYYSCEDFKEQHTIDWPCHTFMYTIGNSRNVRGLGKSMVVFHLFEKLRY